MNYENAKEFLQKHGQLQLLDYYNELDDERKAQLLKDIETTDFSIIEQNLNAAAKGNEGQPEPVDAVSAEQIKANAEKYYNAGIEQIKAGKVAAVALAGGQGSRLGFNKPKGMFDMGLTRPLSIFSLQMKNALSVAEAAGRAFPVFIMTSEGNNGDTVNFFKENSYFGYPKDKIYFYVQNAAPACDFNGKVFLDEKWKVAKAPNGNGGWYSSLINGGFKSVLERENIEWINIYSIDNVLQRICDPLFIGATVANGYASGAKVVKKTYPEEKVGVLCRRGGKPAVMEYFEMPEDLKNERVNGELKYCYGVILNYLFNVNDLNSVVSKNLPYHIAKKAIAHVENGVRVTPKEPCGYKFETLVVDMVGLMKNCLAFEVEREKEFAPVKNAEGVDSVQSARELLKLNGITL